MNTIICAVCGCEITDDNYEVVHDGHNVCSECISNNYTKCDDCGEFYPNDEITQTGNGNLVCENCLSENYSYCEDCNSYVDNDEIVYLDNYDVHVCEDCLQNNYTRCDSCGEYVSDSDVYHSDDGGNYCENCYDDIFTTCEECGYEIRREYANEHDGYYYCDDCYNELETDDTDSNSIYGYHSFNHNNYIPRYANGEQAQGTHLYGIELEVAGSTSYASEVIDRLQGNAIAMYDSSVDGFELVFMPMSRRYIYENLKPVLAETLKYMTDKGFRGHNKGGIHVHFTKLADSMQVANMTRIMYGNEQDRKLWLKITQRKEQAMHWCSMSSCVPTSKDIIDQNITAPAGCGNHGTALNYCTRTNTHELRIFNSNTRIERVLKNLECVFALEDYVARASEPICDTRGFITFVDDHAEDYPILADFFKEKRVFDIASRFYGDTYKNADKNNSEVTDEIINDDNDQNDDIRPVVQPAMTVEVELPNGTGIELDFVGAA